MAAPKRATHEVTHSGLYFSRGENGLTKFEEGDQLTLNKEQAEKLESKGFVKSLKEVKVVDATEKASDKKDAE